MDDLVTARDRLAAAGCLESESDHGATKAVYGQDPDNNTVELTWVLPRAEWGDWESAAPHQGARGHRPRRAAAARGSCDRRIVRGVAKRSLNPDDSPQGKLGSRSNNLCSGRDKFEECLWLCALAVSRDNVDTRTWGRGSYAFVLPGHPARRMARSSSRCPSRAPTRDFSIRVPAGA
jgi:hypothetical protein